MNYYNEIKEQILNNEITKKVKDYSKNRSDLSTYYRVGQLLAEAGKHYGERIIEKYSEKLTIEFGKGYTQTNLKLMRQFFYYSKSHTVCDQLTWSHYRTLLSLNNDNEIEYLISLCISQSLSVRQLIAKIKSREYERLDETTKLKLIQQVEYKIGDFIKNPITVRNHYDYEIVSEKTFQKLIMEDMTHFLMELGSGFSFIANEYKIKIGNQYNYLDFLLYNIEYQCYVVIELKVTRLKKEHIGQIQVYMNYIDYNIKTNWQDKTIGIIICKKGNQYIMEYCSDKRIICKEYRFVP